MKIRDHLDPCLLAVVVPTVLPDGQPLRISSPPALHDRVVRIDHREFCGPWAWSTEALRVAARCPVHLDPVMGGKYGAGRGGQRRDAADRRSSRAGRRPVTLPGVSLASVSRQKVVDYLLSLTSPDGESKARFFRSFAFSPSSWEEFAGALTRHAARNAVRKMEDTSFGRRYIVDGPLVAPDGRTPDVRAVWFIDRGGSAPRFVTAYPAPRRKRP